LGGADLLVGVDADSDYPPEVVTNLPRPGRDLNMDVPDVLALKPDLVLTSLTVPGHECVVEQLRDAGLQTLVCDPTSLADVYGDIRRIAVAIGAPERGETLVANMETAMPAVDEQKRRPSVLVEWWPKPVIVPARQSWVTEIIARAGGTNPWGSKNAKSVPLDNDAALAAAPDVIVMSWCGVHVEKYRADVVRRRAGWNATPAVAAGRIHAISEAFLGRPGPRLVEGYRQLREAIAEVG
jgi:iron complex transport system substrate-binding protein